MKFDTTNLKRQAEEQPLIALGLATAALSAVTKVAKTAIEAKNARTWSKEVKRRSKKSK
jgi:hypothetical protein